MPLRLRIPARRALAALKSRPIQRLHSLRLFPARPGGMAGALATARPGNLPSLLRAAVAMPPVKRAACLVAALARWDDLPSETRTTFFSVPLAELAPAVDNLSNSPSDTSRRHAAEVIALHPAPATLANLAQLLHDDSTVVRRAASRAVRDLALRFASSAAPPEWDAFLADALLAYADHRAHAVLDAAVLALARPGPRFRALLRDPQSPAHFPLRGALRRARGARSRLGALAALAVDPLAAAALERLRAPDPLAEHEHALAARHLLLHPSRRRRLRALSLDALPRPRDWDDLSEGARRGLITWVIALPAPVAERRDLLMRLAADASLHVSVAAERALARLHARLALTASITLPRAGESVAMRGDGRARASAFATRIAPPPASDAGTARPPSNPATPANPATIALARDILRQRGVAV